MPSSRPKKAKLRDLGPEELLTALLALSTFNTKDPNKKPIKHLENREQSIRLAQLSQRNPYLVPTKENVAQIRALPADQRLTLHANVNRSRVKKGEARFVEHETVEELWNLVQARAAAEGVPKDKFWHALCVVDAAKVAGLIEVAKRWRAEDEGEEEIDSDEDDEDHSDEAEAPAAAKQDGRAQDKTVTAVAPEARLKSSDHEKPSSTEQATAAHESKESRKSQKSLQNDSDEPSDDEEPASTKRTTTAAKSKASLKSQKSLQKDPDESSSSEEPTSTKQTPTVPKSKAKKSVQKVSDQSSGGKQSTATEQTTTTAKPKASQKPEESLQKDSKKLADPNSSDDPINDSDSSQKIISKIIKTHAKLHASMPVSTGGKEGAKIARKKSRAYRLLCEAMALEIEAEQMLRGSDAPAVNEDQAENKHESADVEGPGDEGSASQGNNQGSRSSARSVAPSLLQQAADAISGAMPGFPYRKLKNTGPTEGDIDPLNAAGSNPENAAFKAEDLVLGNATSVTPAEHAQSQEIQVDDSPLAGKSSRSKPSPRKSPYFSTPSKRRANSILDSPSKRKPGTPVVPFPPLTQEHFGLIQEKTWRKPFQLLLAVILLNKTAGKASIPAFYSLIERFPEPLDLAKASIEDVCPVIAHLGLQNQRSETIIQLAREWLRQQPVKTVRHRMLHYPYQGDGQLIGRGEVAGPEEQDWRTGAYEIAYLPGVGRYALDSWRIFCRDVLLDRSSDWNGGGLPRHVLEPEWMRVLPEDKELRSFLRWMWLKEGFVWNPVTGQRHKASEAVQERAKRFGGEGFSGEDGIPDPLLADADEDDSTDAAAPPSATKTPTVRFAGATPTMSHSPDDITVTLSQDGSKGKGGKGGKRPRVKVEMAPDAD